MSRIIVIGEAMLELSRAPDSSDWRLGYGGDTLNTAIHLARYGHDVAYATALGNDVFSHDLKAQWADEGIDTSLILTNPMKMPGLYAITTDAQGERSFSYWRETSAARTLFDLGVETALTKAVQQADLLLFSLISLAILPPAGRTALLALAAGAGACQIAFDGNYRPRLWSSPSDAQAARDAAREVATIGLPTLEDEALLAGFSRAEDVAAHWRSARCGEVVVKQGATGCLIPDGRIIPPPAIIQPVDTSGAGDAFNAGYLNARLHGADPAAAALAGHRLGGWVITQRGAIPPRSPDAPYA